ncbi:hypothetical protein ACFLSI_06355, partial [Bacteroidota bacterium]
MKTGKTIYYLTFLIILLLTSCAVSKNYKEAKSINSITAYENYLVKFPKKKYSEIVKQELLILYEKKDWENAKSSNTISIYNDFTTKYPDSKYNLQAQKNISEIEAQQAWTKAINLNAIHGYENFLTSYPNSKYVFDAKNKIQEIKEDIAWNEAENQGIISAYQAYISNFPYGKHNLKAKDKIKQLEAVITEWNKAIEENTPEAYTQFINKFPNSSYTLIAKKKIIDLEVDAIFEGDHGILPPMSKTSDRYIRSTVNDIEVFNNTSYTLTVRYSGIESKKVVLLPQQKQKFTLKIGNYRVAASVNADNVTNYAGEENLEGGSYSSQFYIKT